MAVRGRLRIIAAITPILLITACGGSTSSIDPELSTAVTFDTADSVTPDTTTLTGVGSGLVMLTHSTGSGTPTV